MSLTNLSCGECSVAFCLPTSMYQARCADGRRFYCPNGHQLRFHPSEKDERIAALEADVAQRDLWLKRAARQFDEVYAARESLIAALKECPGGCGWHSRKQVPRDPIAMGRGLERVRLDVAEHLVRVHGARPEPVRGLEARL